VAFLLVLCFKSWRRRKSLYKRISKKLKKISFPLMAFGDFNSILKPHERNGKITPTTFGDISLINKNCTRYQYGPKKTGSLFNNHGEINLRISRYGDWRHLFQTIVLFLLVVIQHNGYLRREPGFPILSSKIPSWEESASHIKSKQK